MPVPELKSRPKWWGWGNADRQPPPDQLAELGAAARQHLGFEPAEVEQPARVEDLELPTPRVEPPASLASICASDTYTRAWHAYGKAYRDIVRAFRGRIDNPPDVVAFPESEDDVRRVLEWCADAGAAAIPYGGGTSVVGGVEPRGLGASVTIDLSWLNRVLEVDEAAQAARVQAGVAGPSLNAQLQAHELTLRHYPQSWEFSTLGGWIATRAGGHFATGPTHIDDHVESVRAITPRGEWESRRLPASGAGPSPDRMLIGSEGILGVITEAWIRVQPQPGQRTTVPVTFLDFDSGARAVQAIVQARLEPSNCRLIDPEEAAVTGAGSGEHALLVLGFEAVDAPVVQRASRALEICRDWNGEPHESPADAGSWRDAFLQAPYLRDNLIAAGLLVDTFETAITWDRFDAFVAEVRERAAAAVAEECGSGRVTCRLTHVYPDGAAPYFTVLAPARRGSEVEQWDAIKAAVSDVVIGAGGTITHHHAVGRDHRPWYDRQRPDAFADALRAAKRAVDPDAILNPGVLIDP